MKISFLLMAIFITLTAQAITNSRVDSLLRVRGLSVEEIRAQGMDVFMGENTGHIPMAKLKILITDQEAIMKNEIESVDMSGSTLDSIKSVRFNGRYILKSDIKAAVSAL